MQFTFSISPFALIVLSIAIVIWALLTLCLRRRSYQEDKEEAEQQEHIANLEAEVARHKYTL